MFKIFEYIITNIKYPQVTFITIYITLYNDYITFTIILL